MFKRLKRWLIVKIISIAEMEWGFHFVTPPDRDRYKRRTETALRDRKSLEPVPSITDKPSSLGKEEPIHGLGMDWKRRKAKADAFKEVQKYRDEYSNRGWLTSGVSFHGIFGPSAEEIDTELGTTVRNDGEHTARVSASRRLKRS